jgi:hypothetical protein
LALGKRSSPASFCSTFAPDQHAIAIFAMEATAMKRCYVWTTMLGLLWAAEARSATVLVETESFAARGGWVLDTQLIDTMGSPYLLAHGLGCPVADARTTVALPAGGTYRVFVRTKDWVARWKASGTPGKFQLLVDGRPLGVTFGTQGADWFWHDGGTVTIAKKRVALALHDLTGFEGRCDAIVLSDEPGFTPPHAKSALTAFRRQALGLPERPEDAGRFDLVVVGGGIAGCCAAITAARLGLEVALIQDRAVLGGNNSTEVRVGVSGGTCFGPYPVLGEVVEELRPLGYWVLRRAEKDPTRPENAKILEILATHPEKNIHNAGPTGNYEDDKKMAVVRAEKKVHLFLNLHACRVEKQGQRVRALVAQHTENGRELRFRAPLFADCTGDGTIGYLAGADWEMTKPGSMGSSNLWRVEDTGKPMDFPRCPWALDLTNKPFPSRLGQLGDWIWESGFHQDTLEDVEAIRDHNFRAMYGAWDCLKNVQQRYRTYRLEWAAYISGKRESRRLLGDVILTRDDITQRREFPDACVATNWGLDLHYPDERYAQGFEGREFISRSTVGTKQAILSVGRSAYYMVPYRCLYSRNVDNLMMAGRDISVSHDVLGTVRVKATTGMMGEVLGRAAYLCKQRQVDPRGVYAKHLDQLKQLLRQPLAHNKAS